MKVFMAEVDWTTKINFVDENNVILGYDYEGSCCEHFGFTLTRGLDTHIFGDVLAGDEVNSVNIILDGYVFDRNYFEVRESEDDDRLEFNNSAEFKAIKEDGEPIFIKLFNQHNGYYGHGFNMKVGDLGIYEGCL